MRRAMAIQLIINREWGLAKNENPNQGSFIIEELTDLVEEAVLKEFEAIAERGGVLGAMETGYQRGKIQEESLLLRAPEARRLVSDRRREHLPQSARRRASPQKVELVRSTEEEKQSQLKRLRGLPRAQRRRGAGGARAPAAGGDRRRQRVRGADGRGARAARSGRSPTRCSRWAASTAATCSDVCKILGRGFRMTTLLLSNERRRVLCMAAGALVVLGPLMSCGKPPELAPGQIWSYKTRPGEGASTVQILHIERGTPLGDVILVSVRGLVSGRGKNLWATEIWPLVFTRDALEKSLTTYQYGETVRRPFLKQLDLWNSEARKGNAAERTFAVPVGDAAKDIEIERPGAAKRRFMDALAQASA